MTMSKDLIFRFFGMDEGAGAQFDKMGEKLGHNAGLWKEYAIGAAVATATIAAGAIKMADEFEQSHLRLESAVKNIGGNFEDVKGAVTALDSRFAKLGFTSTDVESNLANLTVATKSPTKAIKDMSLAADLARGRNMSLSDATSTLVKVETGHVSLLGRLGINTKTATGATLTQTQALQRLASLYGGDASRYADSFSGKVASLKAESEDLGIKLGLVLIPALVDVVGAIDRGAKSVESAAHFIEDHKVAAEALAVVIESALIPAEVKWIATNAKVAASNLAAKFSGVTAGANRLASSLGAAEGASGKLGAVWETAAGKAGIIGAAVVGLYEGGKLLGGALNHTTTPSVQAFDAAVVSLGTHSGESGPTMVTMFTDLTKAGGLASGLVEQFAQKWDTAMTGLVTSGHADEAATAFDDLSKSLRAAGWSTEKVTKTFSQYTTALQDSETSAKAAGTGMDEFGNPVSKVAKKAEDAATAVQTLTTRLDKLVGGPLAEHQQAQQWATDLQKMADAAKGNTGKINDNTKAGLANAKMLVQQGNDLKDRISTWVQDGKSQEYVRSHAVALEKQLRATADATTGNKNAVDRYLSSLSLTPGQIDKVLGAIKNLGNGEDAEAGKSKGRGERAGGDYIDGVVIGLHNKAGAVAAAAASLGSLVNTAFRSHEGIDAQSPSKKGDQAGQDYGQGVANGVEKTAKVVELSAHNVAHLLLKGMTDGWHGEAGKLKDALTTPLQNALDHFQTVIDKAIGNQHDALKRASQNLKSDLASRAADIKSMKGSLAGAADLSDLFGNDPTTGLPTMTNVGSYLDSQVGPLRTFAKDLAWASKHHLSPVLLSEIAGLGAVEGDQVLKQFMSGESSIGAANRNERLIQRYAGQAATTVENRHYANMLDRDRAHVTKQTHLLERIERRMERMEQRAAHRSAHHAGDVTINTNGKIRNLSHAEGEEILKVLHKLQKKGIT
jgi:hypothetical protein